MAHAQKPDFVFPWNGRVHLNRWGCQFSRLLAAEVCVSAWVMLDRPRSEVAWEYWLPTPFASFSFTSPPVRHRVPSGSERALPFFVIAVGSGIQVFLLKRYFGWACLQVNCYFERGETSRTGHSNMRLHSGRRYGNEHSCEDIVTAVVSWSILSLHVCV